MAPSRFLTILAPFLVTVTETEAQPDSAVARLHRDSLRIYRRTIAKPYLKVENRNSFIISEPVNFYGFLAGSTFHEKHTIAAGYYFLAEKSRKPLPLGDSPGATQQILRMSYFKMVYQLVILNKRFIQINIPAEVGAGSFYASTTDDAASPPKHHTGIFLPVSGGLQAIGKIMPWLGLSASGGYRHVTNADVLLRFNGYYYTFGVWVDARQVFRDYRYRRAKRKHFLTTPHTAG